MANKKMNAQIIVKDLKVPSSRQTLDDGDSVNDLFGKIKKVISDLKAVAFSGSYNDLTGKPTVLTGGSQTTTSAADGGNNIFTFTKSDGTTTTITVKNGSKGAPGTNGTTPTIKAAAGANIGAVGTPSVTAATNGTTTTFTFDRLKGEQGTPGADGTRGSMIYWGTAITGTNATATIFSGSGITSALVNDLYINTSTWDIYQCTTAGAANTAKWAYKGSIKGAAGENAINLLPHTQTHGRGYFQATPYIGTAGVMEIGKIIDFHLTDDDSGDFDARIQCVSANTLTLRHSAPSHTAVALRNISFGTGDVTESNCPLGSIYGKIV